MTRIFWLTAASLAAGSATMLAGIGLMASSGYLISRAAERPAILDLMLVFVAVRFFGLTRPAMRYAERLASHDLTFRVLKGVRAWLVSALLPLSQGQLARYRAGDLLSRLAADVDALQESYLRVIAPAAVATVVTAVTAVMLAAIDRRVALTVLTFVAVYAIGWSWIAYRQSRAMGGRRNAVRRDFSADLVGLLQGLDDVTTCGFERRALARCAAHQERLDSLERRDGRALAVHAAAGVFATLAAAWVVLLIALDARATAGLAPIWIAPLVVVTIAAFECVEGLPAAWQSAGDTRDSARRVLEIVRTTPAVVAPERPTPIGMLPPTLELDRVTFGYGGAFVLNDVSLHIHSGEHVAVVGRTGAGKSSLLALLVRAWDPTAGAVRLNGTDLRLVDPDDLRARTAVLPQQVHVFNDTLRENVRLGRPRATDAEVYDALAWAGLARFVTRCPEGLATVLGEHGTRMSAGERQRLGLARVLLTDATLVLADEPTANLDARTEEDVLAALTAWARHRTLVLVSHRPAALARVGRVFRVEAGSVRVQRERTR